MNSVVSYGMLRSMDRSGSLRERNRARTRRDIEDAAWSLFRERGFEATTVDQIAAAAGVSKGTFFRYFATKEDVALGDHAAAVARLRTALAAEGEGGPLERVRRALHAVGEPADDPEREGERARLLTEAPTVRARAARLAEDYADALADGLAPVMGGGGEGWARARIAAGALFGALQGARRAAEVLPSDEAGLVGLAFALLAPGFAGWDGRADGSGSGEATEPAPPLGSGGSENASRAS